MTKVPPTLVVTYVDLTEVDVYASIGVRMDIDEEFPDLDDDADDDIKARYYMEQMNEIALRSLKRMGQVEPDVEMREWLRDVLRVGFPESEDDDPLEESETELSQSSPSS